MSTKAPLSGHLLVSGSGINPSEQRTSITSSWGFPVTLSTQPLIICTLCKGAEFLSLRAQIKKEGFEPSDVSRSCPIGTPFL